jgi:hypothetical protein
MKKKNRLYNTTVTPRQVPDLKKHGTTYFMMTKLLSTRSTCGGGFKVEQDNNNNKRKRARLTGRREEVNHLLQVGTEDVLLVLFAAVVQRLVEGPAQSRDQLLKIATKRRGIISRSHWQCIKQEKQVEQTDLEVPKTE